MQNNEEKKKAAEDKVIGIVRLLLTIGAIGYLVFFVGQAIIYSPDFQAALREMITPRSADATFEVVRDLSYVTPSDPRRSGDIYLPKAAGKPRPAVVIIHGGSWKEGTRDLETETARCLARNGYVAFNIEFRLVGQGGEFPHDIADVKDAVVFLAKNASKYNIDPDKVGLFGSSSGGHMAMLAAYTQSEPALQPECYPGSPAKVAAVASCYGLSNITDLYIHATIKKHIISYMQGKTAEEAPQLYAKASPIAYGRTAVPTFFAHGTADVNVPINQSAGMAVILQKNGIAYEMVPVEGASHWFGPVTRDAVLERVVAFFNKVLK